MWEHWFELAPHVVGSSGVGALLGKLRQRGMADDCDAQALYRAVKEAPAVPLG
jgi:hypothetical protein